MKNSDELRPLTPDERRFVEDNMGLAYDVAHNYVRATQKHHLFDELSQHLLFKMICCVQQFQPQFNHHQKITFLVFNLHSAAKRYFEALGHLRGLNYGSKGKVESSIFADNSTARYHEGTEEGYHVDPYSRDFNDFQNKNGINSTSILVESQEFLVSLFAILTDIERDALILTLYWEHTATETAKVIGKSKQSVERIKSGALKKLREAYARVDGEFVPRPGYVHRPLFLRRSPYVAADAPLLPTILLGSTSVWSKAKNEQKGKKKTKRPVKCPVCRNRTLQKDMYCLYCDTWGMDPDQTKQQAGKAV